MGEELSVAVVRSRFDDHDPGADRIVGAMSPDQRLDDFLASAGTLACAGAKPGRRSAAARALTVPAPVPCAGLTPLRSSAAASRRADAS